MRIETENLTFTYGKNSAVSSKALNSINLVIDEGEFFGIVGQTGSGKSTLVQHFNGLIKVQKKSGKVTIGEFDITQKKCNFKALRKDVGMVFQYPEYQLFAETVFQDVAFGIKNFIKDVTPEQTEAMVKQAIELVGLNYEEIKEKSPFELSGGQKRRVAIAGVIVTKPKVLILDEPAAGLDPIGKREFLKLLKDLHKSFVETIVIVSHDMNLIAENCTKMACLKSGELEYVGSPKEFYISGKAEELGLSDCVLSRLVKRLNEQGYNIDCNLTVKEFVDSVVKELSGGAK